MYPNHSLMTESFLFLFSSTDDNGIFYGFKKFNNKNDRLYVTNFWGAVQKQIVTA